MDQMLPIIGLHNLGKVQVQGSRIPVHNMSLLLSFVASPEPEQILPNCCLWHWPGPPGQPAVTLNILRLWRISKSLRLDTYSNLSTGDGRVVSLLWTVKAIDSTICWLQTRRAISSLKVRVTSRIFCFPSFWPILFILSDVSSASNFQRFQC